MSASDQFQEVCRCCKGAGTEAHVMDKQGIVRGPCYSCLGDGRERALPARGQKAMLMVQYAKGDGLVDAFEANGMMVIPTEEGPYYVTRKDAMEFFGLVEVQPETAALREELRITDGLLEERNRLLREIPGCGAHGDQCVPHAIDWVREARSKAGA